MLSYILKLRATIQTYHGTGGMQATGLKWRDFESGKRSGAVI